MHRRRQRSEPLQLSRGYLHSVRRRRARLGVYHAMLYHLAAAYTRSLYEALLATQSRPARGVHQQGCPTLAVHSFKVREQIQSISSAQV